MLLAEGGVLDGLLAEARAEVQSRIDRAEGLIDAWEHDAPGLLEPIFIGRLREVLRRDPAPVRLRADATGKSAATCVSRPPAVMTAP